MDIAYLFLHLCCFTIFFFVTERYKNAKTLYFILFVAFFLMLLFFILHWMYGRSFVPDLYECGAAVLAIIICGVLFALQKHFRRVT